MNKNEFIRVVESVKAADIHKWYSIEAGFCAITSPIYGRIVVYDYDDYSKAHELLLKLDIKIVYGKANHN